MNRCYVFLPACLITLSMLPLASAGRHRPCGHHAMVCPRCGTCCELKAERVKEEKSCWQVECEQICVPRVVFPWQSRRADCHGGAGCCDACPRGCDPCIRVHNGAWIKTVKKLKKHKYECPACKYQWTPYTAGSSAAARAGKRGMTCCGDS